MIQRPGNCSECGHWDPFHSSWYDPSKEVAEPNWVEEWFPGLLDILKQGDITVEHEDGDWVYHLVKTGRTVERLPVSVHKVGRSPQERSGRKNPHLKGKDLLVRTEPRFGGGGSRPDENLLNPPISVIPQKPDPKT